MCLCALWLFPASSSKSQSWMIFDHYLILVACLSRPLVLSVGHWMCYSTRWRWRRSWTSCVRWWRRRIATKWSCSTSWRRRRGGWSDFPSPARDAFHGRRQSRGSDEWTAGLKRAFCLRCAVRLPLEEMTWLSLFDRKVEDLQFRVEEACITKGDLEVTCGYIMRLLIKHILSLTAAINLPPVRLVLSSWNSYVNYWQTRWILD